MSGARLVGGLASLRVVTWNALALLTTRALVSRSRVSVARKLAVRADVTMLQECHGCAAALEAAFADLRPTHVVWCSPGASSGEGGLVMLVKRGVVSSAVRTSHLELVPGRVQAVRLEWGDSCSFLTLLNIHNFGLSLRDKEVVGAFIDDEALRHDRAGDPKSMILLGGDLNSGSAASDVVAADTSGATSVGSSPAVAVRDRHILKRLTEVAHTGMTHTPRRRMADDTVIFGETSSTAGMCARRSS